MRQSGTMDLTTGSPLRRIIIFALPVLAGNLLQELYNVVDTLIVGQTLGVDMLAAVGSTSSMSFLALGFVMGFTSGCAVLTSQRFGANDGDGIRESFAAHIIAASGAAILLTVLFVICARPILTLLRMTQSSFEAAAAYITVIYAGIPATTLYNVLSSTMRAVGDSRTPLLLLLCSSLLNIVLDLVFILCFHWGVAGAAIATVASQLISGLLCLVYVIRKMPFLLPERRSWRAALGQVSATLKIAVPMGIQFSIISIGMMVLQFVLNGFGDDAVAAYTVGGRIQGLCQNPLVAMSTVMATYVGQNKGAQRLDRICSGVRSALWFSVALSIVIGTVVLLLSRPILLCFVDANEENVILLGQEYLRWSCPFLFTLSFLFVYRGALQGFGKAIVATMGGVLELVGRAAVPLIFGDTLGYTSICIAGPAAWAACGALMTVAYIISISGARYAHSLAN